MQLNGKPQVMVVDDDLSMCNFLRSFLMERGYQAVTLGNAEEAVKRYHAERPAAVILDVVMPGSMDGLEALAAFKKIDREVPIIVLSGQGRTTTVVQAMKLGASDFVSKPFDETDLEIPLANALKQRQLSREVASLREQLQHQAAHNLSLSHSERMADVRDLIERVADTDVNHVPDAVPPAAPPTPASIVAAAAAAGNYSLKAISRTAAREAERELILRMLQHTRWNRKETAENLGISYKALLYKIKENGLDKAS